MKKKFGSIKKFVFCICCTLFFYSQVSAQNPQRIKIENLQTIIDTTTVPLIINFWATTCLPCIKEMPYFLEAENFYKPQQVKLLLVSLDLKDDYPATIQKFMDKNKINAQVLWLDETKPDFFIPKIDTAWDGLIPVTLFVNNQKKYRYFFNKAMTEAELKENIEKMISAN